VLGPIVHSCGNGDKSHGSTYSARKRWLSWPPIFIDLCESRGRGSF